MSLVPRLEDEIQNLREEIESREFQCEPAAMGATEAKMKLAKPLNDAFGKKLSRRHT